MINIFKRSGARFWSSWLRPSFIAVIVSTMWVLMTATPAQAIGILVPRGGSNSLRLVHHRVEVKITERGAVTQVTQVFENPQSRALEATYLFPLPKNATVDEFALWMNGKRQTGKVLKKQEARRIYESIVRRARDPGLIEYVDAQLFQASVFPVPARGRIKVQLIYSHLVDYDGGVHRYVYPMKTDAMASTTLEDFTFSAHIDNKLPIHNLYSPSHRIQSRVRARQADLGFEKAAFSLDQDFVLYWSVDDKDVGLTLLSTKEEGEPGYFMLLASPRADLRDQEIIGKKVSFVVDTSGSMAGAKMDAVRAALSYCLGRLGEDDLFNVIPFGSYVDAFADKLLPASAANIKRAQSFVDKMEAMGGTNIEAALGTALKGTRSSDRVPHLVVFLTDGRPTVGETEVGGILNKVAKQNGAGARIFVLGVGDDVNAVLLDKLARAAGGDASYLRGDASLEGDFKRFYDRVSHPVLTNLRLEVSGVRLFGEHPRSLPDLFKGGQLVVLGRYRGSGPAQIRLHARGRRGAMQQSFSTTFAKQGSQHSFIPRLWAQRQVGMLLAEIRDKGEKPGLVDEVTQLATRFGIVTPYTSYLVVEEGAGMPDPRRRRELSRPLAQSKAQGLPVDDLAAFAPAAEAEMDSTASFGGAPSGAGMRVRKAKKSAPSRQALKDSSGASAVATARAIGSLRSSVQAGTGRVMTPVLRIMGRSFTLKNGYFVDPHIKGRTKQIVIKPFARPTLRSCACGPISKRPLPADINSRFLSPRDAFSLLGPRAATS